MENITAVTDRDLAIDDVIVVAGAGGFIGGHFVKYLLNCGFVNIRAVDKKPVSRWYQRFNNFQNICLDLTNEENCKAVVEDAREVYNFAADMGGMGFIESHRIECMRSVLINTHLLESSYMAGVNRYLFSSSACVYNGKLQESVDNHGLKESDAYPALAEEGYGWEKLYSEMMCQEYWLERGMKTFIPRYHNVYGIKGSWDGGREKAPAAICRKVIDTLDKGTNEIEIWGDGEQTRSFTYIDDAIYGIDLIMHCNALIATPINLGSEEMVSINELVSIAEQVAGDVKLERKYKKDAPLGVRGRSSDNTFIRKTLNWYPDTTLSWGMEKTYNWIESQYNKRKSGQKVFENME